MFGQVGGMYSIIFTIGAIIVGVFASQIYAHSLLSSFYQVSKIKPSTIAPKKRIEESKDIPLHAVSKMNEIFNDNKNEVKNYNRNRNFKKATEEYENNIKYVEDIQIKRSNEIANTITNTI